MTSTERSCDTEVRPPGRSAGGATPTHAHHHSNTDELVASSRERFEESGRFPVGRFILGGAIVFGLLVAGFMVYDRFVAPQEVGGPQIAEPLAYPATGAAMERLSEGVEQSAEGVSFPLSVLEQRLIVGLDYARTTALPEAYQLAAGGNVLPLLAYVTPRGRLVAATSFREPCRSVEFHLEGSALVCDVCYTRWDVSTLIGISGGCFDYPPEQVAVEVRGNSIFVPAPDLEAWLPRAYADAPPVEEM